MLEMKTSLSLRDLGQIMARHMEWARQVVWALPVSVAVLVCGSVATAQLPAGKETASQHLPRSSPEAQGVSSAGIADFIAAADANIDTLHSVIVVRHGQVVAEAWWSPQTPDTPHVMWSLSKSFTAMAVGLAITDGKLNVDDRVLSFFPDEAPANPSENLQAMRVRDLLTMTAGHETEAKLTSDGNWVTQFLAQPVPFEPGTHFRYNTPATYMLSAIVQKVTGETVLDYLQPRLFEPLGIEQPRWDTSPQGISIGGYGLFLRTEDVAKFGQLLLQQGVWEGEQVVPTEWVTAATRKQVPNGTSSDSDWTQGYGYQFWRARHGAFRGDGKDGQFCIVLPEQDAVVAITADTGNLQGVLELVWKHLLPALHAEPLPANAVATETLRHASEALVAHPKPR